MKILPSLQVLVPQVLAVSEAFDQVSSSVNLAYMIGFDWITAASSSIIASTEASSYNLEIQFSKGVKKQVFASQVSNYFDQGCVFQLQVKIPWLL